MSTGDTGDVLRRAIRAHSRPCRARIRIWLIVLADGTPFGSHCATRDQCATQLRDIRLRNPRLFRGAAPMPFDMVRDV